MGDGSDETSKLTCERGCEQSGGLQDHPDQLQPGAAAALPHGRMVADGHGLNKSLKALGKLVHILKDVSLYNSCVSHLQATIMTDPETADKTYIGPMTPEVVATIIEKVRGGGTLVRVAVSSAGCVITGDVAATRHGMLIVNGVCAAMCRSALTRCCRPWAARPR